MGASDKREQLRQQTLKTADNHNQYWTAQEDEIVLTRDTTTLPYGLHGKNMDDVELAVALGRTQLAVYQRRMVLNKLLEQGLTLDEIHDVERFKRTRSNEGRYGLAVANLRKNCDECFCTPHIPGCSKE